MTKIEILLLAIGLSMDALSVSVAAGIQIKKVKLTHAFRIAFFFGLFQALMPIAGALLGIRLKNLISEMDHWIIFFILLFIGAKMIYEAKFIKEESEEKKSDPTKLKILLLLAVATSIDALAVGLSMSLIMRFGNILASAGFIGLVTFVLCFIGVIVGDMMGHFFEEKIEVAGGIILIAVGTKILLEHLLNA